MKVEVNSAFSGEYHLELRHPDGSVQSCTVHNIPCTRIAGTSLQASVSLGSGQGVPQQSDTSLFSFLWSKGPSKKVIESPSETCSRATLTYIFEATASYVGTVTEVGMGDNSHLYTHAMLVDSEGIPISIVKTENDELTVTVILELSLTSSIPLYYKTLAPISYAHKDTYAFLLLARLLDAGWFHTPWSQVKGEAGSCFGFGAMLTNALTHWTYGSQPPKGMTPLSIGASASGMVLNAKGNMRFVPEAFNTHYYRLIQFSRPFYYHEWMGDTWTYYRSCLIAVDLLGKDTFIEQALNEITLPAGDGANTEYVCPVNYFKKDTDEIYKNGTKLTRDVDYTIDNFCNKDCMVELMFLPYAERDTITITGSNATGDRLLFAPQSFSATYLFKKEGVVTCVTHDVPAVVDWKAPRKCDRLKGHITLTYKSTLLVEYQLPSGSWKEVARHTASQDDNHVDLRWETVTAQLWRLRILPESDSRAVMTLRSEAPLFLGHSVDKALHFVVAPTADDILMMNCVSDVPFKNENFALDLTVDAHVTFGPKPKE